MRHALVFFAIALGGAGLDLLSKHLAFLHVSYGEDVSIIPGLFSIGHTTNRGVVFGKFGEAPTLWLIVSIAAVPAIIAIFFGGKRPRPWAQTISLGMILAGTVGNMVDRIAFGWVRDFIKFYMRVGGIERVFPLFNLADSFICVGVFLLSVEMLFFEEKKASKGPESASTKAPADRPDPESTAPVSAQPPP